MLFRSTLLFNKLITSPTNGGVGNFEPVYGDYIATWTIEQKLFFTVISRIFDDNNKKEEFKNAVIKGDLVDVKDPQKLKKKFDDIVDDLAKEYSKELRAEEKLYTNFKKSSEYKNFTDGIEDEMYPKGKTRKFDYTTVPGPNNAEQASEITKLYRGENDSGNDTYIDKTKFKF